MNGNQQNNAGVTTARNSQAPRPPANYTYRAPSGTQQQSAPSHQSGPSQRAAPQGNAQGNSHGSSQSNSNGSSHANSSPASRASGSAPRPPSGYSYHAAPAYSASSRYGSAGPGHEIRMGVPTPTRARRLAPLDRRHDRPPVTAITPRRRTPLLRDMDRQARRVATKVEATADRIRTLPAAAMDPARRTAAAAPGRLTRRRALRAVRAEAITPQGAVVAITAEAAERSEEHTS